MRFLNHISIYDFDTERGHYFTARTSTALHLAARYGHIEMVRLLLEKGAKKDVPDWLSETPAYKAKTGDHTEIVKLLESCS